MSASLKTQLMKTAIEQYGQIFPCAGKSWDECFTSDMGMDIFWFNTSDKSTHMVMA